MRGQVKVCCAQQYSVVAEQRSSHDLAGEIYVTNDLRTAGSRASTTYHPRIVKPQLSAYRVSLRTRPARTLPSHVPTYPGP